MVRGDDCAVHAVRELDRVLREDAGLRDARAHGRDVRCGNWAERSGRVARTPVVIASYCFPRQPSGVNFALCEICGAG